MAFDWTEYLEQAKSLAVEEGEAAKRSAVSRAYYAVYHIAKNQIPNEYGVSFHRHGDSHQKVWDAYKKANERVPKTIGSWGDRLRQQRVEADYKARATINADQAVRLAEATLKEFEKLSSFTPRRG